MQPSGIATAWIVETWFCEFAAVGGAVRQRGLWMVRPRRGEIVYKLRKCFFAVALNRSCGVSSQATRAPITKCQKISNTRFEARAAHPAILS